MKKNSLPRFFVLLLTPFALLAAGYPDVFSRSFEFRAVSSVPAANGETDFKGKTAVFSTEERVAFLNAYADYASAWFGDPNLDQLAVRPEEAEARLAQIKPQPLPSVRRTIRLNDGWRKTGIPSVSTNRPAPWRESPRHKGEPFYAEESHGAHAGRSCCRLVRRPGHAASAAG